MAGVGVGVKVGGGRAAVGNLMPSADPFMISGAGAPAAFTTPCRLPCLRSTVDYSTTY